MKSEKNTTHGCEDAQCPDYAGYIIIDGATVSLGVDQLDPDDPRFENIELDPEGKGWTNSTYIEKKES